MGFESLHEPRFLRENRVAVSNKVVSWKANDKRSITPLDGTELQEVPQEIYIPRLDGPFWNPSYTLTAAWYDSSDLSTIVSSGGVVSRLNDKSDNDAYILADAGFRPATGTRTLNDLNILDFSYGDWMYSGNTNMQTPSDGTFMVFCVAQMDPKVYPGILAGGMYALFNQATPTTYITVAPYSTTTDFNGLTIFRSEQGIFGDPYQNPPHNGPSIYGITKKPNDGFENFVDGTDVYPDMSLDVWTAKVLDSLWIGRSKYIPASYIDMGFAEFVVCPINDETIRQKMEGYLAHKWGFAANLPTTHPYRENRPTV